MLTFVTWKWSSPFQNGRSFASRWVNELRAQVGRNFNRPHAFVCITDDTAGLDARVEAVPMPDTGLDQLRTLHTPIEKDGKTVYFPSCYRRLWMFSEAARSLGEWVFCLDIDVVIVGALEPLVDFEGNFVGWVRAADGVHRLRDQLAGAIYKLRTGSHTEVWDDFDPATSPAESHAAGYRGSDQAWMSHKLMPLPNPQWTQEDGLRKVGPRRPRSSDRVLFTIGLRPPWSAEAHRMAPWLKNYCPLETA